MWGWDMAIPQLYYTLKIGLENLPFHKSCIKLDFTKTFRYLFVFIQHLDSTVSQFLLSMMMIILWFHKAQSTIATSTIPRFIKINVNLRVPKGTASSIARHNPWFLFFWWYLSNQVNCKTCVDLSWSIFKPHHARVTLIEFLKKKNRISILLNRTTSIY